jgi:hypothetical protein
MWKEQIHHSKGRIPIFIEEPKLKNERTLTRESPCRVQELWDYSSSFNKKAVGRIPSVVCEECVNFKRWCAPL